MMIKGRRKIWTISLIILLFTIISINALNFGDVSPDTGEADWGNNSGNFNSETGTYVSTQTNNDIYFTMERSRNGVVAANQTLGFDISTLSTNSSIKIIGINGTLSYCHSKKQTDGCTTLQSPQGTAGTMNIYIENVSSGNFVDVGDIPATASNTETIVNWNTSSGLNFSEFVNETGFVNVKFEFVWTGSGLSAFLNDHANLTIMYDTFPVVTLSSPANDSDYVGTSNVTFECNVSDDKGLTNVTLYHNIGGTFIANQTANITGTSNSTQFNVTSISQGSYEWNCLAFDNVTDPIFSPSNFTFNVLTNISITTLGCIPSTPNLNDVVTCNSTITDSDGISFTVNANVTLPNGTIESRTVYNISSNYYFNFSNTALNGSYNVFWEANDTTNNNQNATDSFSISDGTPPDITLNAPANYFNSSQNSIGFNFTATDNTDLSLNCSLLLDSIINQTNSATVNGTSTILPINNIPAGQHNWQVRCNDDNSNTNTTSARILTIDTDIPNFISLTTSPTSEDDLDPGVLVTISANVTDNTTSISTVILQYKLNTTNTYTNLTMNFVSSTNLYNTTFNASTAGGYNLRLFSNDSATNSDFSNIVNISVFSDRTWTRSPTTLGAASATAGQNLSIGIITLNNTGDVTLNFSIGTTYQNATFNESFPLSIDSGNFQYINVSIIAPSTNSATALTFTINGTPNGNPSELNTTATVVVSEDAFLAATITTFPESVTQGDTVVQFSSKLENVGQLNSTNVTFFYILPTGWTITSGTENISVGDLEAGETAISNIEVTIGDIAAIGTQTVTVNSTGNNESGTSLISLDNILGDSVEITVNSPTQELGSSTTTGGTTGGTTSGTTTSGSSSGGSVTKSSTGETIYTTETLGIVRGQTEGIPITITNLYENAYFTNINLEVQGFLSQYVEIEPIIDPNKKVYVETKNVILTKINQPIIFNLDILGEHTIIANNIEENSVSLTLNSDPINLTLIIGQTKEFDLNNDGKKDIAIELRGINNGIVDLKVHRIGSPNPNKLYYKEDRDYALNIFAPSYLQGEDFNLTVKITTNIVAVNPTLAGFTYKPLTEFRNLLFQVLEISPEELEIKLEQARKNVKDMEDAGFSVTIVKELLSQAEISWSRKDYESTNNLVEQINNIRTTAFEADDLIKEIQKDIEKAKSRWIKIPETEKSIALALKAFERGDFETALQRAKDTQLTYILETKGKINILWFLSKYWWAVILGTIILLISAFLIYKKLTVLIISQRLNDLSKEEASINSLMEETQSSYLNKKDISSADYYKTMAQYESRINKIKHIKIKLKNKRVGIIRTEQELDNIEREEKELLELMKKAQIDYLQKGKLTRRKFMDMYKKDKLRFAEAEEEKEILKEKLEKEKISRKYKFLNAINNVYLRITKYIEDKKIKDEDKIRQKKIKRMLEKNVKSKDEIKIPKKTIKKSTKIKDTKRQTKIKKMLEKHLNKKKDE